MFNRGLTFDDVILIPSYNGIKSRQNVSTSIKVKDHTYDIPLASSNMDTITGVDMAKFMVSQGGFAFLHRFCSVEENIETFKACNNTKNTAISIGVGDKGLERAEALVFAGAKIVCLDVAHGHSKEVNRSIKMLRELYSDNILIVAGNVATYAGADYLSSAGADIIKVGIGNGSVCSTRIKTGFGVPQLTALLECSKVDRSIICDGGIKNPGDAVKALAAGADIIMMGGPLAGTDETPSFEVGGKLIKKYRGSASKESYVVQGKDNDWITAEGVSLEVDPKGPAIEVIKDMMGGIRSGMTYCGASQIKDLKRKAQFMEVTNAGRVEGTPHHLNKGK